MGKCISEYDFELYVDPYDADSAVIGDGKGTVFAVVNRRAAEHGDGLDVARLLRAAPAMLRALEVAMEAYSPNSHLLGVECNSQQRYAALNIRGAIGLALYGPAAQEGRTAEGTCQGRRPTTEEHSEEPPEKAFMLRLVATG